MFCSVFFLSITQIQAHGKKQPYSASPRLPPPKKATQPLNPDMSANSQLGSEQKREQTVQAIPARDSKQNPADQTDDCTNLHFSSFLRSKENRKQTLRTGVTREASLSLLPPHLRHADGLGARKARRLPTKTATTHGQKGRPIGKTWGVGGQGNIQPMGVGMGKSGILLPPPRAIWFLYLSFSLSLFVLRAGAKKFLFGGFSLISHSELM